MADPLTGGLIGAGIKGISSLFGAGKAREAEKARQQAWDNYIASLQGEQYLDPTQYVADYQQIDPEALRYYAPELEQDILQEDTEFAGIETDPRLRQAQLDVLAKISRAADEGLTVEDEAARNELLRSVGTAERGNQEAILQEMARRGQLGSGTELAARMASSGQAYDSAAREAEQLAATRERRAMEAALQKAGLASGIEQTDYSRLADVARARDNISRFNVQQRSGVQQRNIGSKNQATQSAADLRNQSYLKNLGLQNTQAEQLVGGRQASQQSELDRNEKLRQANLEKAQIDAYGKQQTGQQISGAGGAIGSAVEGWLTKK